MGSSLTALLALYVGFCPVPGKAKAALAAIKPYPPQDPSEMWQQ